MSIKRREFILSAASALGTIGMSQLDIIRQGDRYGKVLAQPTSRKLALLVGINTYPNSPRFSSLQGCVTDLDLQKALLVHRFGFNPDNILIIQDAQATRQGILTAFEEHLIKQAKPGDVVVFHFSGHGSRVLDPNPFNPSQKLNSTFVPADDKSAVTSGVVEDIMGRTLFLLMSAVKTDNLTVVLDSCHSGGGTRGNVRFRAAEGGENLKPSPGELEYQDKWISKLNLNKQEVQKLRGLGVAKGVVIASAQPEQLAADAPFGDFHAGAFTYSLTQYLWQQTGTVTFANAFAGTTRSIKRRASNQDPLMDANPKDNQQKPFYYINKTNPPAEAVVTEIRDNQAILWLGGVPNDRLAAYNTGSATEFTLVNPNTGRGTGNVQVALAERKGLIATARIQGNITTGTFLQEEITGVPTDLKLRIGLDPSLGNDSQAAQKALQAVERMEPVPSRSGNMPYEGEVQYILSRMTPAYRQVLQQRKVTNIPAEGSIGLFVPDISAMVPSSFGNQGEGAANAIERLKPKLKSLLTTRLLRLVINPDTSRLNISVTLQKEDGGMLLSESAPVRSASGGKQPSQPRIPVGTNIQLKITNNESQKVFITAMLIDQEGKFTLLFPNDFVKDPDAMRMRSKEEILIPNPTTDGFILETQAPKGFVEILVIASLTSPEQFLQAFNKIRGGANTNKRGPTSLDDTRGNDSNDLVGSLLQDVSRGTRGSSMVKARPDTARVAANQLAALSITFEVT